MSPQRLYDGFESYDPGQLKIMREAFDKAWEKIGPVAGKHPGSIEGTRTKLADVILAVARDKLGTPEELARQALETMFADLGKP